MTFEPTGRYLGAIDFSVIIWSDEGGIKLATCLELEL
jgi:hypothetical protein